MGPFVRFRNPKTCITVIKETGRGLQKMYYVRTAAITIPYKVLHRINLKRHTVCKLVYNLKYESKYTFLTNGF